MGTRLVHKHLHEVVERAEKAKGRDLCVFTDAGVGGSTQACLNIQGSEALADIWVMDTQKIWPRTQSWRLGNVLGSESGSKRPCQGEVRLSLGS